MVRSFRRELRASPEEATKYSSIPPRKATQECRHAHIRQVLAVNCWCVQLSLIHISEPTRLALI
eukprot:1501988-Alexandrium_andersonii.AAC.1